MYQWHSLCAAITQQIGQSGLVVFHGARGTCARMAVRPANCSRAIMRRLNMQKILSFAVMATVLVFINESEAAEQTVKLSVPGSIATSPAF